MTTSEARIRAAISQVAADWYVMNRAGPLSDAQRREFLAWLKASPQHVEEYLGMAALEHPLTAATEDPAMSVEALVGLARSEGSNLVEFMESPAPEPLRVRAIRGVSRRAAAAAAVCAGVAIVGVGWLSQHRDGAASASTFRAGHGEHGTWTLADGTVLNVNTDTVVTVRYSRGERVLDVERGQVAVRVAHDERRAFRIHAGAADVVALGTEFDVFMRPESTLVTVISGQVAVSTGTYAPPGGAPALGGGMRVRAGQQVDVVAGVLPAAPAPARLRESTAWLERRIVFDQRPLGAVADEFNRYNARPFEIADPALRLLKISGAFDANDTESFAAFLESLDGIHVQRLPARFDVSKGGARRPTVAGGS